MTLFGSVTLNLVQRYSRGFFTNSYCVWTFEGIDHSIEPVFREQSYRSPRTIGRCRISD